MMVFIIVCFVTCEKRAAPKTELAINQVIAIKQGQTLQNTSPPISLVLDSVLNDSRCPVDAACITAGNASVQFVFTSGDSLLTFALNTDTSPVDSLAFGYRVELLELSPSPRAGGAIKQPDYSAKVKVTRD